MYIEARDFKHYECYVSTAASFNPTGYSGSAWTGEPNALTSWNGTTNNLFMISPTKPINVVGLSPGTTYYVRVVAVDKSGQRSTPSAEVSCMAGDAQRSSTLVVAASDASAKSKAGADYVCDGEDDGSIINSAIDSLGSGGTLELTEGNYILSIGILISKSDVTISGKGTSTIFKTNSSSSSLVLFGNSSTATTGITIKNILIDGSDRSTGIDLSSTNNVNLSGVEIKNTWITLRLTGVKNSIVNGCKIHDNTLVGSGINVGSLNMDNVSEGVIISDCLIFNNNQGIAFGGVKHCKVNNCVIYSNEQHGIDLGQTKNSLVTNNNIYSNGYISGTDYAGIYVENDSDDNNIQGNTIRRHESPQSPTYGIRLADSTCNGNIVSNNDCYQGGTSTANGGISDAGTGTIFGSGNRLNNGAWATGQG